ncbi:DUF4625 domain-containing protein [Dysgonomonas sp. ZJ279]|uniref:DUF4625 domain-containing protein n=1 Tax=Dysgonomonas sp. ZJ279 TaxID=2709796 RepID=UPI0013EDE3C6|nr:DUF4625 domain-containing protein [Dysgonomonas sp. ZJ279]
MNKRFLLIAIFVLCTIITFFSCEKSTESSDTEPPKIMDVKTNIKDAVVTDLGDSLFLNTDSLNIARIDTIVLGHRILFSARFTDNEALSSYRIVIEVDSNNKGDESIKDATFYTNRGWTLFGQGLESVKKDTTIVKQNSIITTETIEEMKAGDTVAKDYPVREGDYSFKVCCVDKAGNRDSLIRTIRLLSSETILKSRLQ